MLSKVTFRACSTRHQIARLSTYDGRNKLSNHFIPSTKDSASTTVLSSHNLLLRMGAIRQSGAGIYSLLPLGLRVVEKIERIVDEEMQSIGSQKISLPILLNPDDWKKTGRWDSAAGEFFRLKDRKDSDLLLAPTHEEEITRLVANDLSSPKQLPIRLYQIGRKYRDELRPRAGLLRGREFVMKDLYSFDQSKEDAFQTYEDVTKAYKKIFGRLGVPFLIAEADSGNIGGSKSHEYHLISAVGEDTLLTCNSCGYTANEELAVGKLSSTTSKDQTSDMSAQVSTFRDKLGINQTSFDTTFVSFQEANESQTRLRGHATVLTPTGRPANLLKVQTKLSKYLKSTHQLDELAVLEMKEATTEDPSLKPPISNMHIFLDDSISFSESDVSSSLTVHPSDHFRITREGDNCISCDNSLTSIRAIECGHTFYLGTKYSSPLNCGYRKQNGEKVFAEMGCYGIGITRLLAAIADARQDAKGIVWPKNLAPYSVCIVPTDDRNDEFRKVSDGLYDQLNEIFKDNVVIDNRRSGFGAKMKDAELLGYPYVVVVGQKSLSDEKTIELHERLQGKESVKTKISLDSLEFFFGNTQMNCK